MQYYWTSKEPVNGLRHFILLNEFMKNKKKFFELVSVIDEEINIIIEREEFENSDQWEEGWKDIKKSDYITKGYKEFKARNIEGLNKKIFINNDSRFNIS